MADKGAIINGALHHLGETESANPLNDSDKWVRRIRDRFDERARLLFEKHPGNFCTSTQALTATMPTPDGWAYGFNKPASCWRIVKVAADAAGMHPASDPIKYEDRGGRICADLESIHLKFVDGSRLTAVGAWPQHFAELLSADLAWKVSPVTTSAGVTRDELAAIRKAALREWRAFDSAQNPTFEAPASRWQRARRSGLGTSWR